jgi:hypothetical protein
MIGGFFRLFTTWRVTQVVRQLAAECPLNDRLLESADRRLELLGRDRPLANELIENL